MLRLAEGTTIAPGQALRFEAWLMVSKPGLQKVSLLAAYKKVCEDDSLQCFGPGTRCRTSFVSIKVCYFLLLFVVRGFSNNAYQVLSISSRRLGQ